MSQRTETAMAKLRAELEAVQDRLAAAEDMLAAVHQVSASPLMAEWNEPAGQLRERLGDIYFATTGFLDAGNLRPYQPRMLREWAAKHPFTYRVNPVWAHKHAGHADEDFERRAASQ